MDQEHRDKIINNIDKLIQYTSYEKLMDACINNQLLYASMQETIEAVIVFLSSSHWSISYFPARHFDRQSILFNRSSQPKTNATSN